MRRLMLTIFFGLTLAVPAVMAQDPVKVDPKHYKVEVDNSQVRILRVKYGPREKSVMQLVGLFASRTRKTSPTIPIASFYQFHRIGVLVS